jgi:hypothetical protein
VGQPRIEQLVADVFVNAKRNQSLPAAAPRNPPDSRSWSLRQRGAEARIREPTP